MKNSISINAFWLYRLLIGSFFGWVSIASIWTCYQLIIEQRIYMRDIIGLCLWICFVMWLFSGIRVNLENLDNGIIIRDNLLFVRLTFFILYNDIKKITISKRGVLRIPQKKGWSSLPATFIVLNKEDRKKVKTLVEWLYKSNSISDTGALI